MYAKIEWKDAVHFEATADSGHTVTIDGPPDGGGQNRGSRPMELVLMGLGGCASYDVVAILAKQRQKVTDCVTHVTASRVDEIPQVFDRIHLKFVVTGDGLDDEEGRTRCRAVCGQVLLSVTDARSRRRQHHPRIRASQRRCRRSIRQRINSSGTAHLLRLLHSRIISRSASDWRRRL